MTKKGIKMKGKLSILILCFFIISCSEPALEAPSIRADTIPVPEDWQQHQEQRTLAISQHNKQHKQAFDRFADFPVSQTHGVPYILLKLLPKVAPSFWPDDENFLSVIGLFNDERNTRYPLARGIGFSGLSRDLSKKSLDVASFTCGACHIGRVKNTTGSITYLDGGINTEFSVIGFRKNIIDSFNDLTKDVKDKDHELVKVFLSALEKIEKNQPNYFYNNYQFEDRLFDAAYEKQQIELFKKNAETVIPGYIKRMKNVYGGWKTLVEKNYKTDVSGMMAGYGGMEDAIAFNTVDAYLSLKESPLTYLFSKIPLADYAGQTDIMAVWDQQKRNPEWNKNKDDLINGGGQWNGHIPLPIYKNIAAQLTLGVDDIDVQVSAFADEYLDQLPAAVYPFDIDLTLARKGKVLFEKNCQVCHQANNGKVYKNIGTHMGRAKIADSIISWAAVKGFTDVCSADLTLKMQGKDVKPCGSYKGVSLKGKEKFSMTKPARHAGYNALPLTGIWAQAPYLHNGSVPTMYHLLMPETRPSQFVKSRLSYDQEKMGFEWSLDKTGDESGYLYNTEASAALSYKGHDKNIEIDNVTYKLNWNKDETSVKAIIEYMKVL